MRFQAFLLTFLMIFSIAAQDEELSQAEMSFEEYNPESTLVVPEHIVTQAKYPFIDMHSHQWNLTKEKIARLVE